MIESTAGVMAALVGIAAFYFWLARYTGWKLFKYLIPLIWIYATPMVLRNVGVLPGASPAYDVMRQFGLPMVIAMLLMSVNVGAAVRVMGKGVLVMLMGTVGVMVGAPIGLWVVKGWLAPDAWTGFGALAGSWIGGTAQMAAVSAMIDTSPEQFGLAVLADNVIFIGWLPLLLVSKSFANRFNRWARVPEGRLRQMELAAAAESKEEVAPSVSDVLYLFALALGVTWLAGWAAPLIPQFGEVVDQQGNVFYLLSTSAWNILLVTTFGILLSFTPARNISSSHSIAMAILYVFVARMGAIASLEGLSQAVPFVAGAAIWIVVHGLFCLLGARLFHVDIHSVAIASAANIGAAASAPVVAAHHSESLVPAAVLMAMLGYAIGTYAAYGTALLCLWVAG